MTLHQLQIFESVARHLNITQASLELHASQPAVSQQLKLLEKDYGVRFLARLNHGVKLTAEGRAFLEEIKPLLAKIEDVKKSFRVVQKAQRSAALTVGGSGSMSVSLLPKLLAVFKTVHPKIGFVLESSDSRTLERRVLETELDLAVITNPSHSLRIAYEPYERHRVVAFVASAFPLLAGTIKLRELAEFSLVLRRNSNTLRELEKLGFPPSLVVQCETAHVVKAAVYRGMGIGVLHRDYLEHDISTGAIKTINVPELEKLKVRSYIIYDPHKSLSSIAQDFLSLLREKKRSGIDQLDRTIANTHFSASESAGPLKGPKKVTPRFN